MGPFYENDPLWPVELFDHVEVEIDGHTFEGQVRAIYRDGVTVRYENHQIVHRTTGTSPTCNRRVPMTAVTLVRRDG